MKILFLILITSLLFVSCQSVENKHGSTTASGIEINTVDTLKTDLSPTDNHSFVRDTFSLTHDNYATLIKESGDTVPAKDFSKYRLEDFTRLKDGQDHFQYYILKELSYYPLFKTLIIAEYYDSETAAWIANYSQTGELIASYEVYYDNAEGFYSKISFMDMDKKTIQVKENNIYENPENKTTLLTVNAEGLFVQNL